MSSKGVKQPTAGPSKKSGGKSGRRQEVGPPRPMGPSKEDAAAAAAKAARVFGATDNFIMGKLASSFNSLNSEANKQGGEEFSNKDSAAKSGENVSSRAAAAETATTAAGNEATASAGGGGADSNGVPVALAYFPLEAVES